MVVVFQKKRLKPASVDGTNEREDVPSLPSKTSPAFIEVKSNFV